MTYAVLSPTKTPNGTKVLVTYISDDKDEAITVARGIRSKMEKKGFHSWAKKVAIKCPLTPEAYQELANSASEYGHLLDDASNGNSFMGQQMIDWANTLRIRADELWDPESYAA